MDIRGACAHFVASVATVSAMLVCLIYPGLSYAQRANRYSLKVSMDGKETPRIVCLGRNRTIRVRVMLDGSGNVENATVSVFKPIHGLVRTIRATTADLDLPPLGRISPAEFEYTPLRQGRESIRFDSQKPFGSNVRGKDEEPGKAQDLASKTIEFEVRDCKYKVDMAYQDSAPFPTSALMDRIILSRDGTSNAWKGEGKTVLVVHHPRCPSGPVDGTTEIRTTIEARMTADGQLKLEFKYHQRTPFTGPDCDVGAGTGLHVPLTPEKLFGGEEDATGGYHGTSYGVRLIDFATLPVDGGERELSRHPGAGTTLKVTLDDTE